MIYRCRADLRNRWSLSRSVEMVPGFPAPPLSSSFLFPFLEHHQMFCRHQVRIDKYMCVKLHNFFFLFLMHIGNHTFAVAKGAEGYDLLSGRMKEVMEEINQLVRQKWVEVEGKRWQIDVVFGGDYKVKLCAHTHTHTLTHTHTRAHTHTRTQTHTPLYIVLYLE